MHRLTQTLKGLTLRPAQGAGTPAKVSGKKYVFATNKRKLEALTLESDGGLNLTSEPLKGIYREAIKQRVTKTE